MGVALALPRLGPDTDPLIQMAAAIFDDSLLEGNRILSGVLDVNVGVVDSALQRRAEGGLQAALVDPETRAEEGKRLLAGTFGGLV